MKKQHLIALDLDGTLLTDNKIISARTKKTIEKAKEQGHIVVISTGRPFRASHAYYKELNLNTPIVNFNGAYVHHPLDVNWELITLLLNFLLHRKLFVLALILVSKIFMLKSLMMYMFVKLMKIKNIFLNLVLQRFSQEIY